MHIAVDAANLSRDRRGIGRYARALISRWLRAPDRLHLTLIVPDLFVAGARHRLAAALGGSDIEVRRRSAVPALRPDIVWYPWNGMTWTTASPSIATVHDVWPFVSPADDPRTRKREQTTYMTMAARTSAIIANSHFTKSEIIQHLPVREDLVHVVHMGVDLPTSGQATGQSQAMRSTPRLEGAERYVLFVGEDEPRKDLATLQTAMEKLPRDMRDTTGLVIAGKANSLGARGRIESRDERDSASLFFARGASVPTLIAGEVSDALLHQLYAGASAFAFPSRYEGFGLPVLEAMAHGVPVVASNAASVPEVGGGAALYFPVGEASALADALARVLLDAALAQRLRDAGLARAAEFSWDRCADATLAVFDETIGMPPV